MSKSLLCRDIIGILKLKCHWIVLVVCGGFHMSAKSVSTWISAAFHICNFARPTPWPTPWLTPWLTKIVMPGQFCNVFFYNQSRRGKTMIGWGHVSFEWLGGPKWTFGRHIANQLPTGISGGSVSYTTVTMRRRLFRFFKWTFAK